MSKQSEAKAGQNYRVIPDTCSNCGNYKSQMVEQRYNAFNGLQILTEEKEKRCKLGGFSVKKTATCDCYFPKQEGIKA